MEEEDDEYKQLVRTAVGLGNQGIKMLYIVQAQKRASPIMSLITAEPNHGLYMGSFNDRQTLFR